MVTLNPKIKQHLKNTSAIKQKCFSKLIQPLFSDDQSRKDAITRADASYAQYKKTREYISLERLAKNNNLNN
jgi:hypothetical protein